MAEEVIKGKIREDLEERRSDKIRGEERRGDERRGESRREDNATREKTIYEYTKPEKIR